MRFTYLHENIHLHTLFPIYPSFEIVMKGVEVLNGFQPDWIVGLGGGSPIDAAKAMWIFYEYPSFTFEEAAKPFNLPTLRTKAKFIAIATTSGTGTEVTSFSVITDNKTGIKYPIADFNITPDIAIVDPDLAQTMPEKLVAYTGTDALTHAFEAYVSNAILGIVHSMAHKTGKVFNIAHGCANAVYLPYVIEFNRKTAGKVYADIAKRLNLSGNTEDELVDSLVSMIKDFNKKLNIPSNLKEFGLNEEDFKNNLDEVAETSVGDPCTGTNPRKISVDEMKKLFTCTFYGEKVNF